ncbi:phage major capsid protein [Terrisporobacter mayombei]|uniref:Phage capsid-like C-terminal domain-containing protein n=1 Tax=Terrisporobacter mayombei TaxID=1541 RepID=A0ABY9Q6M4_9FIRM|nr:phage major capsid protein [Terrisporobacter mayombei]MCC3870393.1 phage major capsid protein [Terrisporobacter mayombei]WMT83645.1 hypothetical protein TEMA_41660 [Terrisporobacter mayombei]
MGDSLILSNKLTGLIPEEVSKQIVKKVVKGSYCLQNSRREPMKTVKKTIPVLVSMPGPTWVGEGEKINVVEPGIVPVTLEAKKLSFIITASREALEDSVVNVFKDLQDSISEAFCEAIDKAIITGSVTEGQKPFKTLYEVAEAQSITRGDGVILDDFSDALALVENKSHEVTNIIAVNSIKNELRKLKTSTGEYLLSDTSSIFGTPTEYLSHLDPITSLAIMGNIRDFLVTGVYKDITYDVLREATLDLGSGKQINLAQNDLCGIRVTMRIASNVLREEAFSLIKPKA